jgi:hypothetical protein
VKSIDEVEVKILTGLVLVALLSVGLTGCKKSADPVAAASPTPGQPQTPEAEIRAAIQAHLAHQGTLNLQAFDTQVKQVTIQGDRAQAQVDFRVKNGPGAMQLTYQLEKRGGNWAVIETNPVGSDFSHPALDQSQNPVTGGPAGTSHSLGETLKSFKAGAAGPPRSLPPAHPSSTSNPGFMPQ